MALFFANDRKELMPIAIQLFQKPSDDNPVSSLREIHMLLQIVNCLCWKTWQVHYVLLLMDIVYYRFLYQVILSIPGCWPRCITTMLMLHSTSPALILVSIVEILYHSLMPLNPSQSVSQKMFLHFCCWNKHLGWGYWKESHNSKLTW